MSPRPAPSRDDATAKHFLDAAADLIDAYLQAEPLRPEQSARLRQIRFPAALEWLRIEDVIKLARTGDSRGVSRKAFFNRWPTKDDFLADAVVHAAMREHATTNPSDHVKQVPTILDAASFSAGIASVADNLLDALTPYPRSYIALHLGPLLPQHPKLWEALLEPMRADRLAWAAEYKAVLDALGLRLRPEWTADRISLALQTLVDGFVLRSRVQPDDIAAAVDGEHTLIGDTIVAFVLGILDWTDDAVTARAALDDLARKRASGGPERGNDHTDEPRR